MVPLKVGRIRTTPMWIVRIRLGAFQMAFCVPPLTPPARDVRHLPFQGRLGKKCLDSTTIIEFTIEESKQKEGLALLWRKI